MLKHHGNHTTARFPRTSRDAPPAQHGCISGPHRAPMRPLLRLIDAVLWMLAIFLLVSIFKAPAIWSLFA